MTRENSQSFACSICGYEHTTMAAAHACELQGLQENSFELGDRLWSPIAGGVIVEVVELVTACYLNHAPGVIFSAVEGNIKEYLDFFQDPNNTQFLDQETAERILIRR